MRAGMSLLRHYSLNTMSIAELNTESITASSAPSDPELIERFVTVRDQLAFAELVRRHSPVVMGVCRRVLRDTNDIEDAFQATFLVLIRDVKRVRKQASLASWLYGVAYRISAHATRQKRRRRETPLVEEDKFVDLGSLASVADRHDQQLLDAELNALPERYRRPLVLRYLTGKSSSDIATELGLTIGTVDGLIKRGKDALLQRLLKRGVITGTALVAVQLTRETASAVASEKLIEATIQAGLAWDFPTGRFSPEQLSPQQISTRAFELAGKEVLVMATGTKAALTVGLTLSGLALAAGTIGHFGTGSQGTAEAAGIVSTLAKVQEIDNIIGMAQIAADPTPVTASDRVDADGKTENDKTPNNSTVSTAESNPPDPKPQAIAPFGTVQLPKPAKKKWDTKKRSARTQQILTELDVTSEANFVDVPLHEAIDVFKSTHGISVQFDNKALSEDGISTDIPVNLTVSDIPLKNTLRLMLDPLQLDYVLENDQLIITTQTRAQNTFETRVYFQKPLIASPTNNAPLLKQLVEVIPKSVEPDSWAPQKDGDRAGGEGTISLFEQKLIIRQTQRVHDEINEFLDELLGEQRPDETTPAKADPRSDAGF